MIQVNYPNGSPMYLYCKQDNPNPTYNNLNFRACKGSLELI